MTDDLIKRLRAMSRCEHDDLSIGDEAAEEIERLDKLREFAKLVLARCWTAGAIDGSDVEEIAEELGLITLETYDLDKHGPMEDELVPGEDKIYVFADWLKIK